VNRQDFETVTLFKRNLKVTLCKAKVQRVLMFKTEHKLHFPDGWVVVRRDSTTLGYYTKCGSLSFVVVLDSTEDDNAYACHLWLERVVNALIFRTTES
jgi:hypothetical protein